MKVKILLLCIGISTQLFAQNKSTQETIDYQNCSCQKVETASTTPRYYPLLNQITNYTMFTKFITWKLVGGEDTFNNLFYRGAGQSSNADGSGARRNFTLIARNPVLFHHPQDSISINLTPCKAQVYEFDVNAFLSYPINRYMRNYDFEKEFDNYAQSYMEILCATEYLTDRQLVEVIFVSKNEEETKSIISQINKKYKADVLYDQDREYLDYIPVVLREKEVPLHQFITDMFIKTDDKIRPINEKEKERINKIFNPYFHSIFYTNAINTVKELITPTVNMSSVTEYISFIIDSKMLHKPNNKTVAAEILTHISHFNVDTKKGLTLEIKEICLPQSEIAGTGVLISYTSGNVRFENSSRLVISNAVNISIPSKELTAEVKNLNINNQIISGDIILPDNHNADKITRYLQSKGFKINVNNEKIHFVFLRPPDSK